MMKLYRNLLDAMRSRPRRLPDPRDVLDTRSVRDWADMPRPQRTVRTERD